MAEGAARERVLIAGCGDLGIRAGRLLAAGRSEVWGLRRSARALPEPLGAIRADLTDPESLAAGLGGVDPFGVLIYAVAADRFDDEAYEAAYVRGLRLLLEALPALPRRLVYVSSTSVYGQTDGSVVNEESPTEPSGFSGRRLLEGEAVALGSGIEATVVRFGGIYGPGRTRLIDTVREGRAVCYDEPPIWTNRMHVDDCARAVEHLARLERVDELYVGVDDEPSRDGDVKRWLAERLGVAEPPPADGAPSATSRRMRSNKRCSNARLRSTGLELRYPTYREGYGSML